jgi:hypothetical protein
VACWRFARFCSATVETAAAAAWVTGVTQPFSGSWSSSEQQPGCQQLVRITTKQMRSRAAAWRCAIVCAGPAVSATAAAAQSFGQHTQQQTQPSKTG